ncbi:MAG: stage II sporulation protein R [Defluviitaleaceae bacterium]|nr:stage II sporulation protein R [Defluviitaleaceae bacterium]
MKKLCKELKIVTLSIALGLVLAFSVAAYTYVYSATTQQNIADNVIRFHVLANSDSYADQAIKDIVRDEVLTAFEGLLQSTDSVKESRQMIKNELPVIQAYAETVVRELGFDYPVEARLDKAFFPTQTYGDLSFPPGIYEALQITIGSGVGQNWWCLMFPPLCFVDMTSTPAGRQQMEDTVSDEAFRLLTFQDEDASVATEVRFRVVEWWQNRRQLDTEAGQVVIAIP